MHKQSFPCHVCAPAATRSTKSVSRFGGIRAHDKMFERIEVCGNLLAESYRVCNQVNYLLFTYVISMS